MNAVQIHPLAPSRLDDYLLFFEQRAFTDNPRWAGCYCYFPYHDPNVTDWQQRSAAENREAICACINAGQAQGYLAYVDGAVVGWCNAAPRALYPMLQEYPEADPEHVGAIFCFLVAPEHRGHGVAAALLDAACAGLKAQGLKIAQAKPVWQASGAAANHFGPLSMYLAAGFKVLREDADGNVFVHKRLV